MSGVLEGIKECFGDLGKVSQVKDLLSSKSFCDMDPYNEETRTIRRRFNYGITKLSRRYSYET